MSSHLDQYYRKKVNNTSYNASDSKNFCLGDYFVAIFIEFLILYLFSCGAYFSSENENRSHFRIELNPQYVS